MSEESEKYEEWRVTGIPDFVEIPYDFTWSQKMNKGLGDPETQAKRFYKMVKDRNNWRDGPHLFKRTVTLSSWEAVDD